VRITVLGKSPSWPDAGGACSGYLIQAGGYRLLLDCGTGVFAALREQIDYFSLDAVLITHMHSDHFFDLIPFSYALTHSPRRAERSAPQLHVPPGAREVLAAMVGAWGDPELVPRAFDLREYDPAAPLALGPLTAHLREVPHYTTTYAVRLTDATHRLTFSADCGPNDALIELARDCDLLLIEATHDQPGDPGEPRGHLTAHEAGDHGRRAGARRLVITHFSDELDAEDLGAQASKGFGASVQIAQPGAVYELG
jgi:ribonuclease BN (tRNA processing enzyme)